MANQGMNEDANNTERKQPQQQDQDNTRQMGQDANTDRKQQQQNSQDDTRQMGGDRKVQGQVDRADQGQDGQDRQDRQPS